MKLVFYKGEDGEIAIKTRDDKGERAFSYTEMIQFLYDNKCLMEAEFDECVSEVEREKLRTMIERINRIGSQLAEEAI